MLVNFTYTQTLETIYPGIEVYAQFKGDADIDGNETVKIKSLPFFEHGEWRELKIPDDSTRDNRYFLEQIIWQARKEKNKILENVLPIF